MFPTSEAWWLNICDNNQQVEIIFKSQTRKVEFTLNSKPCRSTRSWLLAIVGAEYVLGLLPRGTHEVSY